MQSYNVHKRTMLGGTLRASSGAIPFFYDGLIQDIDEGRVHIGGCCVTGDDPE